MELGENADSPMVVILLSIESQAKVARTPSVTNMGNLRRVQINLFMSMQIPCWALDAFHRFLRVCGLGSQKSREKNISFSVLLPPFLRHDTAVEKYLHGSLSRSSRWRSTGGVRTN